jgi:hypothetical protein
MRCKDVVNPKRVDDGGEDEVVGGKRKGSKVTRESAYEGIACET